MLGSGGEASMAYQDEGFGHEEHGHAGDVLHRRDLRDGLHE
jgi:hypothetical protein